MTDRNRGAVAWLRQHLLYVAFVAVAIQWGAVVVTNRPAGPGEEWARTAATATVTTSLIVTLWLVLLSRRIHAMSVEMKALRNDLAVTRHGIVRTGDDIAAIRASLTAEPAPCPLT